MSDQKTASTSAAPASATSEQSPTIPPVTSEGPAAKRTETGADDDVDVPDNTDASGSQTTGNNGLPAALAQALNEPLPQDDNAAIDADEGYEDSAYGTSVTGGSTSVASSIYRGIMQNGRRYQSLKEDGYWGPSDEKQFESQSAGHQAYVIRDSQYPNPLFRSPIDEKTEHVLDFGTGSGEWAIDVADHFPNLQVHGVDLYPPPQTWVPPNCVFEVDDLSKPWTWSHKFDLVHLRMMTGSFSDPDWQGVYNRVFENLAPGGWIEQFEVDINYKRANGDFEPNSTVGKWGGIISAAAKKSGRPALDFKVMTERIKTAGFTNVHEHVFKIPIGTWPKHPLLKEAGRLNYQQMRSGSEGFAMYLLTNFGEPEPWTPDQVQALVADFLREIDDRKQHFYVNYKRVWAQKPLEGASSTAAA